jgi:hypothetical protein
MCHAIISDDYVLLAACFANERSFCIAGFAGAASADCPTGDRRAGQACAGMRRAAAVPSP